jgi:CheY-like chemotaxis protein
MKSINPEYPYMVYGDDHSLDHALVTQLMKRVDPAIQVICVANGLEVFHFLEQLPQGIELPGCIVLDMDMPIWDGMRTLKVIKEHTEYHPIPCFLFSNSTAERDRTLASTLGAESFITKSYIQQELQVTGEQFAALCKKPALIKGRI